MKDKLTVAYLGPKGTYSEEAAYRHFGEEVMYLPEKSIDEAIAITEKDQARVAVVPIENSTEGGVSSTYDHLLETPLQIIGEVLLSIHHQLLSQAKELAGIKEITAHPQALAQCRQWIERNLTGAKQIAASSNSEAAAYAARNPEAAAIASARAGEIYQLPVLATNIEDDPSNTTRFIMLGRDETKPTGSDKTSLVCSTPDKPGALYRVLGVLADQGINMVKLESRPVRGSLHDYMFYIDIDGHKADKNILRTLELLKAQTKYLKILGSYQKADPNA